MTSVTNRRRNHAEDPRFHTMIVSHLFAQYSTLLCAFPAELTISACYVCDNASLAVVHLRVTVFVFVSYAISN